MFNWFFNLIKITGAKKSTEPTNNDDKSKPQEVQLKKEQDPFTRLADYAAAAANDPELDTLVPNDCIPGNPVTFRIKLRDIGWAAIIAYNSFANNTNAKVLLKHFQGGSALQELIERKTTDIRSAADNIVEYLVFKYLVIQKKYGLKPLFNGLSKEEGKSGGILPENKKPKALEEFIEANKGKYGLSYFTNTEYIKLAIIKEGDNLLNNKSNAATGLSAKIHELAMAYYKHISKNKDKEIEKKRERLLKTLGKNLMDKLYASQKITKTFFQTINNIVETGLNHSDIVSMDQEVGGGVVDDSDEANLTVGDTIPDTVGSTITDNADLLTLISAALEEQKQVNTPKEVFIELQRRLGQKLKKNKNENNILPFILERYLIKYLQKGIKTPKNFLEGSKLPDRLLNEDSNLKNIHEFVFDPTTFLSTQSISKGDFRHIINELLSEAYDQYKEKNPDNNTFPDELAFIEAYNSAQVFYDQQDKDPDKTKKDIEFLDQQKLLALKIFDTLTTKLFRSDTNKVEQLPISLFLNLRSYIKSILTLMNRSTFSSTGIGAFNNELNFNISQLKQDKAAFEQIKEELNKEITTKSNAGETQDNLKEMKDEIKTIDSNIEKIDTQIENLNKQQNSFQNVNLGQLNNQENKDVPSDSPNPTMETVDTESKLYITKLFDLMNENSTYNKDKKNTKATYVFKQIARYFDEAFSGNEISTCIKKKVMANIDASDRGVRTLLDKKFNRYEKEDKALIKALDTESKRLASTNDTNAKAAASFLDRVLKNYVKISDILQTVDNPNSKTLGLISTLLKCLNPNIKADQQISSFLLEIQQAVLDNTLDENTINNKLKELFPITDTNKVDYSALNFPKILKDFLKLQQQAQDIQDINALEDNFTVIRAFDSQNTRFTKENAPILNKQTFEENKNYFNKILQKETLDYLLHCFELVKRQIENRFKSLYQSRDKQNGQNNDPKLFQNNLEKFKDKLLNPDNFQSEAEILDLKSLQDLYDNPNIIVDIFNKQTTESRRGEILFTFFKYINYLIVVRNEALRRKYRALNPFLDKLSTYSKEAGYVNNSTDYIKHLKQELNNAQFIDENDKIKEGTVAAEVLYDITQKENKKPNNLYGTDEFIKPFMFDTLGADTQVFIVSGMEYLKRNTDLQQSAKESENKENKYVPQSDEYLVNQIYRAYPSGVVFYTTHRTLLDDGKSHTEHYDFYAPNESLEQALQIKTLKHKDIVKNYQKLSSDYARKNHIIIEPQYYGEPADKPGYIVIKDAFFPNYFLAEYNGELDIDPITEQVEPGTNVDIDKLENVSIYTPANASNVEDSKEAYLLLSSGKVKENDPQYNKVLDSVQKNAFYSYLLLYNSIIKEGSSQYNNILAGVQKNAFYSYLLLYEGIIKRGHEQYDNVLTSALNGIRSTCRLVKYNIIKENDPQYKEALNKIIQNGDNLVSEEEITQEELNNYKEQLNIQQGTTEIKPGEGGGSGETTEPSTNPGDIESKGGFHFHFSKVALLKDKIPYLTQSLKNTKISEVKWSDIITLCNKADPTGNKAQYTQWILNQYIQKNFKGEEDVAKYNKTLQGFMNLKERHKIQPADIYQYKSYGDLAEKVDKIQRASGLSKSTKTDNTGNVDGIEKLGQDGDIELFLVNKYEAARKEFATTKWCVKEKDHYDDYADKNPNFYLFKKNGQPYLLLHETDFKDVNNVAPSKEHLKEVAHLMLDHDLPQQSLLVIKGIVTKESKNFEHIVKKAVKRKRDAYELLDMQVLEKGSKEYAQAINTLIENKASVDLYLLIRDGILEKGSKECAQALNILIENKEYRSLYILILSGMLEEGSKEYAQTLNILIENKKYDLLFDLIRDGMLEEGSEYYEAVLNCLKAHKKDLNSYNLIIFSIIEEDSAKYKAKRQTLLDYNIYDFIKAGYPKEDSDMFKLVIQALINEKDYSNLYLLIQTGRLKEDSDMFKPVIQALIDSKYYFSVICELIEDGRIKEGSDIFKSVIQALINDHFIICELIEDGHIKEGSAMFKSVIQALIDEKRCSVLYKLVINGYIKKGSNAFTIVIHALIQADSNTFLRKLVNSGILTQEELDTYKRQLNKQEYTEEQQPGHTGQPDQQPETAPAQEQPKPEEQTQEKKDSTEEYKPTDNENNLAKKQGFNIYLQKKAADEELPYTPNTFETSNVEGVGYNPGAEQSMVHKETEKHFSLSKLGLLLKNAMRIDKSFVNYLETTIKQADIPNPDQIIDFINCLIQAGGEPTNATRIYNQKNATNKDRSYFWRTIKRHIWPTLRKNDTIISVAEKLNCNDIIEE